MKFNIIFQSSRQIIIELLNEGIYYTNEEYSIYLNDNLIMKSKKVVQTINNLLPDTKYSIQLKSLDSQSECIEFTTDIEFVTLNIKDFGARGDGKSDDTIFIQTAILACPKFGRVLIPKGTYNIKTLFLKSDLNLELAKGAVLSASTNKDDFPILPGLIKDSDEKNEYNLGTWEGNPEDMFAGIITGINVSNVVISGEGIINGNANYNNWWKYPTGKEILGAFRPRLIFLNKCKNITITGITTTNSPSWTIHPYFCEDLKFIDMIILNPKDSPNTDGLDIESCKSVDVIGTYFSLGDDCIAIKSGKFYMGQKYKTPSCSIQIRQSCMNEGHGAVTIGSEMAAGIKNLFVTSCLFTNTDRGLRIKTRRGRGKNAIVENILFENIIMENVLTPFVVNSFYNCCDPDANSCYVRCKDKLPIDDRTPNIKYLVFKNIKCYNSHIAGAFFYGLPEQKINEIVMENIYIDYAKDSIKGLPAMMDNLEPISKMGIFANNVKTLKIKNISIIGNIGEKIYTQNVDEIVN